MKVQKETYTLFTSFTSIVLVSQQRETFFKKQDNVLSPFLIKWWSLLNCGLMCLFSLLDQSYILRKMKHLY